MKAECLVNGIWNEVNPDAPDSAFATLSAPAQPKEIDQLIAELNAQRAAERAGRTAVRTTRSSGAAETPEPTEPPLVPATFADVQQLFSARQAEYTRLYRAYIENTTAAKAVHKWLVDTVDPMVMELARSEAIINSGDKPFTPQTLVRILKSHAAPSNSSLVSEARNAYARALNTATIPRTEARRFYANWNIAYQKGVQNKIPEVVEPMAAQDFLRAAEYFSPEWARGQRNQMTENEVTDQPSKDATHFGRVFNNLLDKQETEPRRARGGAGVFATFGQRSDSPSQKQECPCNRERHPWKPTTCRTLIAAASNAPDKWNSAADIAKIRARLLGGRWSDLVKLMKEEGVIFAPNQPGNSSFSRNKPNLSNSKLSANGFSACIIDMSLLETEEIMGVYSTTGLSTRHPLADSTLVDNCGAMHLVNAKELLVPGSIVKAKHNDVVQSGTSWLPVTGRGKRIIQNVLAGPNGPRTAPLTLNNVALIEGFHTNIVSEALLLNASIWYLGLDCTLRVGTLQNNVLIAQLARKHNLAFLEYKELSSCSKVPPMQVNAFPNYVSEAGLPFEIPSNTFPWMFPTLDNNKKQSFRTTRDYLQPRSDSDHIWHQRAGHLGPEALRKLVEHARNVKIQGVSRLKCEHCAITHAQQVISRRAPERKSPRPFWRIQWDLFDYIVAYNRSSWLLVIKDEFSGKLFGYDLVHKDHQAVFGTLESFDAWTRRQYNLAVCKIKHDNDKSVIPINGTSGYQAWADTMGIELELSPTYTHEPNGGAERAGKEVIEKALKMQLGANLPAKLWPETAAAAVRLYNMSPAQQNEWRSPNETLDAWFRNYFRFYTPEITSRITVDLRPNWTGIYVYGCRAYPLMKERAGLKDRKAFKVSPRAHIGYLVGYEASNIYRIWVPVLDRVIRTRNVRFDEDIVYSPERERAEGPPIEIAEETALNIEIYEDIQDAEDLYLNFPFEVRTPPEQQPSATTAPQSDNTQQMKSTAIVDEAHALPTPEPTPEPEVRSAVTTNPTTARQNSEVGDGSTRGSPSHTTTRAREGTHSALDTPLSQSSESRTGPTRRKSQEFSHQQVEGIHNAAEFGPRSRSTLQVVIRSKPENQRAVASTRTIVAPAKKKRRRKDHGKAKRASTRLRGNKTTDENASNGVHTVLEAPFFTVEHKKDQERMFHSTFWPDIEKALGPRDEHRTVHAVIAAAILQSTRSRNAKPPLNNNVFATATAAVLKNKLSRSNVPPLPRIHQSTAPKVPRHWRDLQTHPFGAQFEADAELEIANLEARECWRQVPSEETQGNHLPLMWVFTYKVDSDGHIIRCRSRIVVRGDLQDEQTIVSTYAATLAARSFRISMALAAHFDLEIKQYDVVNAFINAKRDPRSERVVCSLPDGFKKPGYCVEIDRALYGMRDSPALWYQEFAGTLKRLELIPCLEEPCIFMNKARGLIIVFFVDDVLLLYHKDDELTAKRFLNELQKAYELRDMSDAEWFLGVRILRDRAAKTISLAHDTYIEKIAKKFGLDTWKCPSTPLPLGELLKSKGQATKAEIKRYQELVGSLLYAAIITRPDVAFASSQLSHFLTNPDATHREAVEWAIRYLFGSRYQSLTYGGTKNNELQTILLTDPFDLVIASDASYADNTESRRSSHGFTMSLFGGLIDWRAARQDTITTSTTEAELLGVSLVAKQTMALQRFFKELELSLSQPWTIWCDNQQTIRLVVHERERISTKLRHVDIQNMWMKQEYRKGTFDLTYLPTDQMPADGLTKNLSRAKFEHFRALLNLQDISAKIVKE